MLEAEARRARGAQKPPTPGEELRKVPGSHPELQIHLQNPPPPAQPITLLPLTARAAAELLQQKKSQKKTPVVQHLFTLGCLHAQRQGNQVVSRKSLAQGAARRWPLASPQPCTPPRALQDPQGNDLPPNLLLLRSRDVCFKPLQG